MEAFGLFNFLKTLLSDPSTQSVSNLDNGTDSNPEVSTRATTVSERKEEAESEDMERENAYVQFLQAHEARIKRLK